MGRFLKPDNIVRNAFNPQSWNLYSYVNGNPVNFNDPSGHYPAGFGGAIAQGTTKKEYLAPPGGGVWELTTVEYFTFVWTDYYSVTVTKDVQGNVLSVSDPTYMYSSTGWVAGSGGFCSGNSGSRHFRESYAGDPVIGKFLFSQLKQQLTEIVFSLFVDLTNPNLTYILFGYDQATKRKIDESSNATIKDVWYDSVRFALSKNVIWIAFGHVEPGVYFSSNAPFYSRITRTAINDYKGSGFAGSENDVKTYKEYYKGISRENCSPIFVILFGQDQWFKFSP